MRRYSISSFYCVSVYTTLFFCSFSFECAPLTLWLSQEKMTLYHKSFREPEVQRCLSTCIIKSVIMLEFFQFLGRCLISASELKLNLQEHNVSTPTSPVHWQLISEPLLFSAACLICSRLPSTPLPLYLAYFRGKWTISGRAFKLNSVSASSLF